MKLQLILPGSITLALYVLGDASNLCTRRQCVGSAFTRLPNADARVTLKQSTMVQLSSAKSNSDNDETLKSFDDVLKRRTKDEWIGGQEMKQIIATKEQQIAMQERRRAQQRLIRNQKEARSVELINFKSIISYTDANTLEIEFPAAGMRRNTAASGAFAAVWFGTIAPATVSMLSTGLAPLLFMAPFWLAGAVVAKNAIYDPFVSSKLTIGKHLWTLESKFLRRVKAKEGSTETLRGATVDVSMVVNGVPIYELQLFSENEKVAGFGQGFEAAELEHLSEVINEYIDTFKDQRQ